jgi:hypothetical protein
VKAGNTVDFSMNLSGGATNIFISLKRNTVLVASAIIDTNSRNRNLIWRERAVDKDSLYEVAFKGKVSATIAVNAFQWGFKTHGPDYVDLVSPD